MANGELCGGEMLAGCSMGGRRNISAYHGDWVLSMVVVEDSKVRGRAISPAYSRASPVIVCCAGR